MAPVFPSRNEPEGVGWGPNFNQLDHPKIVINIDGTKLRTPAPLRKFLDATPEIKFTLAAGVGNAGRHKQISRVLKRFDYPKLKKAERGVAPA